MNPRPLPLPLWIALGLLAGLLLRDCLVLSSVSAQPRAFEVGDRSQPSCPPENADTQRSVPDLERALLVRMRLGANHEGGYVRHCREQRGGCEAYIARLVLDIGLAAARWEIDAWLLASVALRESGLNPAAIGTRGDHGVVQLLPGTPWERAARLRCREAPSDCTAIELDVAAELLARSVQLCGSEAAALGRYSTGRCGVTEYSRSVLRLRNALHVDGARLY